MPSIIDFASQNQDSSASSIVTRAGEELDVQVGDILVACAQHSTAGDTTVTFSGGNVGAWIPIDGLSHSGVGFFVDYAYGVVTSAGTGLSITATLGAARPYRGIAVVQIRPDAASTLSYLGSTNVESLGGGSGVLTTPGLTFDEPAGFIIGLTAPYVGRTFTPTAPATEVYDPASYSTGIAAREITAAGSFTIGITWSVDADSFLIAVGFEQVTLTAVRPTSDITKGWIASTGTDHFALLDEVSPDDNDYIYADGPGLTNEIRFASMAPPATGTSVDWKYRVRGVAAGGTVTVSLYCGATLIKTDTARTANGDYTLTTTAAEWASVADWNNMRLRLVSG